MSKSPRLPKGLLALTMAKFVMALSDRWVSVFLPVLTAGFGLSTQTATSMMATGQLGGLTTVTTGRLINARNERRFVLIGLGIVLASSLIALTGAPWAFFVAYLLLVIGHTQAAVACHAWIGHRVPYTQRSRSIGIFESSWALALLVGAPILAAVVSWWSWRAGYVTLLIATVAALAIVRTKVPDDARSGDDDADVTIVPVAKLGWSVWPPILASALSAIAGIGFFAIAGQWFSDHHGIGAGGLGIIAGSYGLIELASSTSVATITDRIGPKAAVLSGLALVLVGVVTVWAGEASVAVSIVGVLVFLGGFEYAFVSSLTLVTEAAPHARGTAIGLSNAVGTFGRATGVFVAGQTYVAFGVNGPLVMSSVVAVLAAVCVALTRVGSDHEAEPFPADEAITGL